ncbi:MAG: hypothetical protein ACJ8AT_39695 [Hyalangium sp.]|uniref:hypothetical protein n=1 Tax=Hyalangium sp. TaxID=2028555 RepID=UPI00389B2AC2
MRTLTLALGLLLFLPLAAWAEEPTPLELSKVPQEGKSPQDFVPSGWKIEATTRGDLDKNGSEDVVLELVEAKPAESADGTVTDRSRALLVLLSSEGGKLRRAGASNRALYCIGCQGMLGGGEGGVVKIDKGVIIIDQLSGSREMTHTTLRFRFDPQEKRFMLIGEDVAHTDRAVGSTESQSTNLLTGTKVTEKRQFDQKKNQDVLLSSKKQKVAASKRYLEDVDISAY